MKLKQNQVAHKSMPDLTVCDFYVCNSVLETRSCLKIFYKLRPLFKYQPVSLQGPIIVMNAIGAKNPIHIPNAPGEGSGRHVIFISRSSGPFPNYSLLGLVPPRQLELSKGGLWRKGGLTRGRVKIFALFHLTRFFFQLFLLLKQWSVGVNCPHQNMNSPFDQKIWWWLVLKRTSSCASSSCSCLSSRIFWMNIIENRRANNNCILAQCAHLFFFIHDCFCVGVHERDAPFNPL